MEGIVILILLAALGVLSLRFGRDSRDGIRSQERELAAHGIARSLGPDDQQLADELQAARWRRLTAQARPAAPAPATTPTGVSVVSRLRTALG